MAKRFLCLAMSVLMLLAMIPAFSSNAYAAVSGDINHENDYLLSIYDPSDLTHPSLIFRDANLNFDLTYFTKTCLGSFNFVVTEWNTEPDGSGDGYTDSIPANTYAAGDEVSLYPIGYYRDRPSFNAVLLLDQNANVPDTTVNFTIAAGTGIAAVPGTSLAVIAPSAATGVTGTPTIGSVTYSSSDTTVTSVSGVPVAHDEKAVVKPVEVDFTNVEFSQPGIFRYLITEPSSGDLSAYDVQRGDTTNGVRYQRVLDVYVVRNANDEYEIGGFVFHEVAGTIAEGATTASDKSGGFVNEYDTTGITVACEVEGNQSSIDKYFAFTITIDVDESTNPVNVDWSGATEALNPVANPATTYSTSVISTANNADDSVDVPDFQWAPDNNGVISKTIYLKHDQLVEITGIPVGATYSVVVTEEDYGPSWTVSEGATELASSEDNGAENNDTDDQTLAAAVQDVLFILTRDGFVPTGVAISAIPGIMIATLALAAILGFLAKRKQTPTADKA